MNIEFNLWPWTRNLAKYGFRKAVFTTEHDHGVIYFGEDE